MLCAVGKLTAPRKPKIIMLFCIASNDGNVIARGHNVLGIPNIDCAVTTEKIKIESRLHLLCAGYD